MRPLSWAAKVFSGRARIPGGKSSPIRRLCGIDSEQANGHGLWRLAQMEEKRRERAFSSSSSKHEEMTKYSNIDGARILPLSAGGALKINGVRRASAATTGEQSDEGRKAYQHPACKPGGAAVWRKRCGGGDPAHTSRHSGGKVTRRKMKSATA